MQYSKDVELKTAFREHVSPLEVFKIRSLEAHYAVASELKHHQKCWNEIVVNRTEEVLYASAIPSSTKLESLKSPISMPSSSAESMHFSSFSFSSSLDSVCILNY